MTQRRANTQHGVKWHLWSAGGMSACGTKVTKDAAPFDSASVHSCQICVSAAKLIIPTQRGKDYIERQELGLE